MKKRMFVTLLVTAIFLVGTTPVTDLLEDTGAHLENGIVVDEHCRASVEGIYAAGDVANHLHPLVGGHIRVEHWQNALKQGAAAAKAMLGSPDPYDEVHWFWSDQYDTNIQSAGQVSEWTNPVIRPWRRLRHPVFRQRS